MGWLCLLLSYQAKNESGRKRAKTDRERGTTTRSNRKRLYTCQTTTPSKGGALGEMLRTPRHVGGRRPSHRGWCIYGHINGLAHTFYLRQFCNGFVDCNHLCCIAFNIKCHKLVQFQRVFKPFTVVTAQFTIPIK